MALSLALLYLSEAGKAVAMFSLKKLLDSDCKVDSCSRAGETVQSLTKYLLLLQRSWGSIPSTYMTALNCL